MSRTRPKNEGLSDSSWALWMTIAAQGFVRDSFVYLSLSVALKRPRARRVKHRLGACPHTFHVAASESMYVEAIAGVVHEAEWNDIFVIHEATSEGRSLFERFVEASQASAAESLTIESAEVNSELFAFDEIYDQALLFNPDVVAVFIESHRQEVLISHFDFAGFDAPVIVLPYTLNQSRESIARLRQAAPNLGIGQRVALWEASANDPAGINERYTSMFGMPMDPSAWAAFAAIKVVYEAAAEAGGTPDASALIAVLESPETTFEVGKGTPVKFTPRTHQLRQPLYLIQVNRNAPWGRKASDQLAIATVVSELPDAVLSNSGAAEWLDEPGSRTTSTECN